MLEGIDALLERRDVAIADLSAVIHGSTLVTNALIERKGAPTAMLVTEGFRDVLYVAQETRYDLYDLRIRLPEPVVPRHLRVEIAERIRYDGSIERAPQEAEVAAISDQLQKAAPLWG